MANNQLLASDYFLSGSLAAGWSALTGEGFIESVVVTGTPNVTECTDTATWGGQFWSGLSWPSDQACELTAQTLTAEAGTVLSLFVRWNNVAAQGYMATLTNNTLQCYRFDSSSSLTQLGSTVTGLTFAARDVWTFQAAGSCLSVYQNGNRVFYFYDATYTSGSPAYRQLSLVDVTHCQVSAFRGYNAIQQDGVWQKQGIVLPAILADLNDVTIPGQGIQGSEILYGPAQLLSGNVYKMWLASNVATKTNGNIYYAESADGLSWTRKVAPVLTGYVNCSVYLNAGTYYLYTQPQANNGGGHLAVFTSPDGVNWTLAASDILLVGGVGTWDHAQVYPLTSFTKIGSLFYALYAGGNNDEPGHYQTGLATSPDLLVWTKYASNPVNPNVLPIFVNQVVSTYYVWFTANQPGQGNSVGPYLDPFEMVRYQSTDYINWTNPVHSMRRTEMFESLNANTGGIFAAAAIDIGGKAYFYTNSAPNDGGNPVVAQISLAIAPAPIASIVSSLEDATEQIAEDNFTSGAGDLSANWTTPAGSTKLKIVAGDLVEATAAATVCTMCYTGASFDDDQYSEITVATLSGSIVYDAYALAPAVRMQTGANSWYGAYISEPTGTLTTIQVQKTIAGTGTAFGPSVDITFQIGDVFRLQITTGSDGFPILSLFQNGFLIIQAEDYSNALTSGYPGMIAYATTTLADAQIGLWAGGNANVIPSYLYSITGNVGVSGATVTYSGTSSGSVTADGSGNYTISGIGSGSYMVTPSKTGYTFSPASLSVTVSGANSTGNNSTATQSSIHYSVPDCRLVPNNYRTVNGTKIYDVQTSSNSGIPPTDSRAAGAPTACGTYPQNSRTPGTYGPNE